MIHDDKSPVQGTSPHLGLRQVEINTYSVAGGVHSDRVAEMHRSVSFESPSAEFYEWIVGTCIAKERTVLLDRR